MKERLFELMQYMELSSTQFADKLGVERSTISHIKSNRSKPSLELVTRVLSNFPEVNSEWLILGKGEMMKATPDSREPNLFNTTSIIDSAHQENEVQKKEVIVPIEVNNQQEVNNQPIVEQKIASTPISLKEDVEIPPKNGREIERVLIFYTDKTFEEYVK